MKILIIKLSAIGDVVQTLPALEAIKGIYPTSEITWVVEEAAAGILDGHPLVHRVLISRRKSWFQMLKNPLTFFTGMKRIVVFLRELRSTRFDIAIDFQGLLKSGILIGLARAHRKIGFDRTREFSYLFLNEKLPAYDKEKHALERYLDVARYLGAVNPSSACVLPMEREVSVMKQRIKGVRQDMRPLIVINPVARWKTKLWPEQKFAELADRIIQEQKAVVIFTGSSDDRMVIKRIAAMMRQKAENWAGETTLKELAALASLSNLFITTDTGPMHMAAAAGVKVLALFGPTAPWRTGPHGESHIVVRKGLKCSPCFHRKCDDIQCMEAITVEEVMDILNAKMQSAKLLKT
jgi:heptosyltransferase-1